MEFKYTQWTVKKLISTHEKSHLDLNPPYQRNFIWSTKDQAELINSIAKVYPLPSVFLYERTANNFEVVDGQQRCRTIINYYNKYVEKTGSNKGLESFLAFSLPVTIITGDIQDREIEKFYTVVNKSGLKVNNPELKKSEFFDTVFLRLNNDLAKIDDFKNLGLFAGSSIQRMNDIDFVSELTTYLVLGGVTDKKESVDKVYQKDITEDKAKEVKALFELVVGKISNLNKVYPISDTRYKQRNDFYTLFQFVKEHNDLPQKELEYFYEILVTIAPFISPSETSCAPLREYARNCVTQSNSKTAREKRYEIMSALLMGNGKLPSSAQEEIKDCFDLGDDCTVIKGSYTTFKMKSLNKLDEII